MKHSKTKKQLEELGYTYQPLYASDIPCANKDIGDYHIWAWLDKSKDVDITGIGFRNENTIIINFYLQNKDKLVSSPFFKNYIYLRIYFNPTTLDCKLGNILDLTPPEGYRTIVMVESSVESLIDELIKIGIDIKR